MVVIADVDMADIGDVGGFAAVVGIVDIVDVGVVVVQQKGRLLPWLLAGFFCLFCLFPF